MIFRSPLPKLHYYHNKHLQVKESQVPYQPTVEPLPQLDLFCSDNFPFWCTAPKYVTNQSDVRIPIRGLLLCMNPSMWLTPHQPFDCCSWFAAALHRNTNKIFNVGARDFAWLQNPKAYKKRSKNSFFCRRRLRFQKENLMKLFRVRFFFLPSPLNRSLMGSPIPNRFTQTLDFFSPIRIIQTHKQIAF